MRLFVASNVVSDVESDAPDSKSIIISRVFVILPFILDMFDKTSKEEVHSIISGVVYYVAHNLLACGGPILSSIIVRKRKLTFAPRHKVK